jgi:hypothetical protein
MIMRGINGKEEEERIAGGTVRKGKREEIASDAGKEMEVGRKGTRLVHVRGPNVFVPQAKKRSALGHVMETSPDPPFWLILS